MIVVIFRAKIRKLDDEYLATAARMRELALTEFSCLEFHALSEGDEEIALSYWPDEASIKAWREHPEHKEAQRRGQEKWYRSYRVELANISREYRTGS
jgi:heme-degrading monooxygenase HmoA